VTLDITINALPSIGEEQVDDIVSVTGVSSIMRTNEGNLFLRARFRVSEEEDSLLTWWNLKMVRLGVP
jgi:hypothetical protein